MQISNLTQNEGQGAASLETTVRVRGVSLDSDKIYHSMLTFLQFSSLSNITFFSFS